MDEGAEVVWPPETQRSLLPLSQYIFFDPPHSAASLSLSSLFFHSAVHLSVTSVSRVGALIRVSLGHAGGAYTGFMSRLCIQEGNAPAVTRSHYVLPR